MIQGVIFDWVGTLYKRNTGLFEEAIPVLQALGQKYHLGLVSLAGQGIARRTQDIKDTGIWDYFNSIVIATRKEEEQFLQCMKEMGVTPESTLVVGDRTIREISIGNHLGCQTYWIQKGDYAHQTPTTETGNPTKIITSIKELLDDL